MSTVQRIQELLDCAIKIPIRDVAKIIIPAGIDAQIRIKALNACLKIAQDEEKYECD